MKGKGNTYPPDVTPTVTGNIPPEEIRTSFSVPEPNGISKAGDGPKASSTGFKNAIKKFDGDFPVSYITFKTNNTLPSGNYGIPNQNPFHLFDTGSWDVPPIPFFVPNSTDFNTFWGHNIIVKLRFAKGNLLSCGCSEIHIEWYSPWSNPASSFSYKTENEKAMTISNEDAKIDRIARRNFKTEQEDETFAVRTGNVNDQSIRIPEIPNQSVFVMNSKIMGRNPKLQIRAQWSAHVLNSHKLLSLKQAENITSRA